MKSAVFCAQFLQISFAGHALKAFREAAREGQLDREATGKALAALGLQGFVQGGDAMGLPLGQGEEWQRLWRLWSKESHVDEQLFGSILTEDKSIQVLLVVGLAWPSLLRSALREGPKAKPYHILYIYIIYIQCFILL